MHCQIWKVNPSDELTLTEINQLSRNVPDLLWLDLTGGEPTDRGDLPEIVEVFKKNCSDLTLLHFPTNGLASKKIISQAKAIRKVYDKHFVISVSLDGPPKIHNQLRGIPGNFKSAIETYKELKKLPRTDVYFGMTVLPENHQLVNDTVKAIAKHIPTFKFSDLHINLGHSSEHYYENSEGSYFSHNVESLRSLFDQRALPLQPFKFIEWMYLKLSVEFAKSNRTPISCEALRSTLYISEKGEIYPCSIWNKPLGNLRDHSFNLKKILESPKTREARKSVEQKKCPNCWTPCEAYTSLAKTPLNHLISVAFAK